MNKEIIKDEIRVAETRLKKEKNLQIIKNIKNYRIKLKKILKTL